MKRFRLSLLVVLMLSIVGTWNVQAQYYVVDQTNGDGINVPNVDTIVPGTPYALLCSNEDGSDGQYLCNAGKSTIITDSCLFVFEVVSTNDAGEKVYVLKRNTDGKYLMWNENLHFSAGHVAYTTDLEEAYKFTAGKADWVEKETIGEMTFADIWAAGYSKFISVSPIGADSWVFPAEPFDQEEPTYFSGWWGDKVPAFWSYIDTNAWKVVPVYKAQAYEWLSILLSDQFPNGFIADMYVAGTNPGQCDQDAIDDCQSAYAACCDLVNNESTDDDACRAAGEALITAYDALIASVKLITPGYYYFVNGGRNGVMYSGEEGINWASYEISETPTYESTAYIWKVSQSEEDSNLYYLQNFKTGKYVGAQTRISVQLPQSQAPFGYYIRYSENNSGNLAGCFNILNPANPLQWGLHAQFNGNIVYWTATETASLWQVITVDEADLEALRPEVEQSQRNSELTELVSTAQEAYDRANVFVSDATDDGRFDSPGIIKEETQLASNATEPSEGSIGGLIDGSFETYFHSMWSATPEPNDWHYLQADLGKALDCLTLKYAKRPNATSGGDPTQVEILGSNDADMNDLTIGSWESEGLYDLSYPNSIGHYGTKENHSGILGVKLSKPYRYLRMVVKKTLGQQLNGIYPYWYFSEFRVYEAIEDSIVLSFIPEDVVSSMLAAIAKANEELANGAATQATIDELTTAYEVWLDNYPVKDMETDGICYNLDKTTQKAVVINGGTAKYSGDIVIPETITVEDVTYTVTSVSESAFSGCSGLTSITLPNGITSIGRYAFNGCSGLTSFVLPESVTSIGEQAFYGCSGLTSITLPDGLTTIGGSVFSGCSGLTSITIPEGVTSIGESAFNGCSGLTSITLPDGLTSIGDWAFKNCISMTSIALPESVTSIGENAFNGCSGLASITLPEGLTSIEYGTFRGCSGLTSIVFPNGLISIGDWAFAGCGSLTSITLPESVTSIGNSAFNGCGGLTSIVVEEGNGIYDSRDNCNAIIETGTNTLIVGCKSTIIPNGITSIGNSAFYGCSDLTSITLPEGVTSIGAEAFSGCLSLSNISIPDGITSIHRNAFNNTAWWNSQPDGLLYLCSYLLGYKGDSPKGEIVVKDGVKAIVNSALYGCSGLTSITLPDGVTSIGNSAFYGCSGLTSITLPDGVSSIGDYAFRYCSGLTSITLPDSVTSIGDYAFSDCTGLTSITLPDGVTSIGNYAFFDCSGLTSITLPDGVTSIGNGAFVRCSGLTSITLSTNLTSIGDWAFSLCSGLTSITLPEGVTSIGSSVFDNCNALQSVKMSSTAPPAASERIFNNCPDTLVIYVPTGAAANYDVAPWNNFQIVEESSGMEDYAIWASDMRTRPTKPITLSVQLNNVNAISDYQFDLTLPKGFSIAMDEDDLEMIYLSTERTTERKHTYSYNMLSDSLLRVICYSNSTYTFSGTEGEVLTITLDVAADVADGDYNLMIKNIEMTEPDGTAHKASDYPCKVTVISYTPGDVNDDGNFSVTDVRGVVNMVLAAQVPDDNPAADVNEDGVISVTDVRGAVNLVLNPVAPTALLSPKMRAATSTANMLYIEPFTIAPGEEKEVWVMLNNPDDAFSDIQFDLYLPDGIEVVNDNEGYLIGLGSRTDLRTHNRPEAALQRDGSVRVVCYSDKAETFFGHSGDVMRLMLKASDDLPAGLYNLQLKNVELARPDMTNDRLQASTASVSVNGNATGIDSLEAEMERGEVYDLNGRRVLQSAKGVYIINGKKVIIK